MNKSGIVSIIALIMSITLLAINFYHMETLTITSCAICAILFGISSYRSIIRNEHLKIHIMIVALTSLVIGTVSPFLGTTGAIAAFLETLSYIFVAMFLIMEMIAFMGVRLDKVLFEAFSLLFSMAIASFAAVVTYLIRIEDIRSEIIVNNDIVVQFAASFIISVVVLILMHRMMKKRDIRLITGEILMEESL